MNLFDALIGNINKVKQEIQEGRKATKPAKKLMAELAQIIQVAARESSKSEASEGIQQARDALNFTEQASKTLQYALTVIGGYVAQIGGRWLSGIEGNAAYAARHIDQLKVAEKANTVTESLRSTGKLPSNYITKAHARAAGWKEGKAVGSWVPGAQIGGDIYFNLDGLLPSAPGRVWYEVDVGLKNTVSRSKQPGHRLLFSDDGLTYITADHYENFYRLPNWK